MRRERVPHQRILYLCLPSCAHAEPDSSRPAAPHDRRRAAASFAASMQSVRSSLISPVRSTRFWNREILRKTDDLLEEIRKVIQRLQHPLPALRADLSRFAGEVY